MDIFIRTIAVIIEVLLLGIIAYSVLVGVRLIASDLGLKPKYNRMINTALIIVGCIVLTFFIAHLTLLYPTL